MWNDSSNSSVNVSSLSFLVFDDIQWNDRQMAIIASIPPWLHFGLGVYVSLVSVLGLAANALILVTYFKYNDRLRTPANIFIVNMAASDLTSCVLHSMGAYSNFRGRWAFGRFGCELYGGGVGVLGVASILLFSAVAFERYLVIVRQPMGRLSDTWKMTCVRAKTLCATIWLWCAAVAVLPLVGVSRYVPEGIMTTCTWDYTTRTTTNRVYYIVFLITGFVMPVGTICFSYASILASVCRQARHMVAVTPEVSVARKLRRNVDIRTAQTVVTVVVVYLTAWTPYAVVTVIGQFGPVDYSTTAATAAAAYFAKLAVVIDPLVYGFSHPHFRAAFRHYLAVLLSLLTGSKDSMNNNAPIFSCNPSFRTGPSSDMQHQASRMIFIVSGRHCSASKQQRQLRSFRQNCQLEQGTELCTYATSALARPIGSRYSDGQMARQASSHSLPAFAIEQ